MMKIHAKNPYKGFAAEQFATDLQGWGFGSPIFEHVIKKYRPSTMIEVGTWKGASAIEMAGLMKAIGNPEGSQLICVDTWLGSVEHWLNRTEPTMYPAMNVKWGRPQLYEQFLANVIHSGHEDIIVPFPVNSSTAAKFFLAKGMLADAIYLDAGHQYDDVMADLIAYWKVLRRGGVLFGDDYILGWIGLVRAVHDFVDEHPCSINTSFHHKFLIEKLS